ncbi:acyltransferase family protein [Hymenobacter crusticola]|uniref:Acyltransferase 3 domain-containing protein n=1 Tax=Hymenobacter crusticola TaxID=1770526 RepID=A0A243WES5_9BACT|nr:acyltransferase [Hymenobacter crusticola]OUJ73386.1 hypothetical protein BXP70_13295 [Hymenobacter crusticola]
MDTNRRYFHTFDTLRFFSFLLVFIHHIPIPNTSYFSFFSKSGGEGVVFFFVLSGFLITYVLVHEKKHKGAISLKNFFARRVLRIWPLFYAALLFAFSTSYLLDVLHIEHSSEGYEPNWLMSIFFLENYKMIITNSFPNVAPLRVMWSLCVEEHFYIVWGVLVSLVSLKRIPFIIFASIVFANIARGLYIQAGLITADLFTDLDYFAFGAIPAYILVVRGDIMKEVEEIPLTPKYTIAFASVVLVFAIPNLSFTWLNFAAPLLYGTFFSATILFTLTQNNYLKIEKTWLSKLGVYTYGLYLFHTVIINLFLHIKIPNYKFSWVDILFLSLVSTILVSIISYHVFEKQFLKLKKYFYN